MLAVQKAWTRKWSFLGLSLCFVLVSVIVLGNLDLLPNPPKPKPAVAAPVRVATSTSAVPQTPTGKAELPVKIAIPAISLAVNVLNPVKTDIASLDNALLSGAVRYPGSAKLNEFGNVVVFGHSSYLPVVHNPAYKAFNEIQKLKEGDAVIVYSSAAAYTYKVRSVSKEDAKSAAIPLAVTGKVLTLATCNSFGAASDRFVVVADLVESHPVSS